MRGLWDHEQLLSPSLVRSAIALLGGFLAAVVGVNVVMGIAMLARGEFLGAIGQVTAGIGYPFAVWLGVRMLADQLALQHRTHDKVAILDPPAEGARATSPASARRATGAAATRAGDDGVIYPED